MIYTIGSRTEKMLRDLGSGLYHGLCAVYADPDDTVYLLREFKTENCEYPQAVQIVVRLSSGTYIVREYLHSTAGWKDSDGCVSFSLSDLLPKELIAAELIASYSLTPYLIGAYDE